MEQLAQVLLALLFVAFVVALVQGQGLAWLRAKFLGKAG